jgi:ribonuclease E
MQDATQTAAENGDGQTRRRRRRGGRGGERGERGERAPRENFPAGDAAPADPIESRAAQPQHERHSERDHAPAHEHTSEPGNTMAERHAESEDAPMYDPRNDGESPAPQEPVLERTQELKPAHEPKLAYSSAALPRTFQAVSEHDAVEEEAHRPQRKRREAARDATQQPELQLVETQVEAAPIPVEDEAPHRTKPRRRRSGPAEAEPLMLVETQGGAETRPDGAPVP